MKTYDNFIQEQEDKNTSAQAFADKAKAIFLEVFPNSFISASVGRLGEPSVLIKIALGKSGEFANNIIQNDPMHQVIHIEGWNKDGTQKDVLSASNSNKGFMVKSSDPKFAYESIKVWRAFKGDEKKVLDGLKKYFLKLKEEIKVNLDKLPEYVKDKI